MSSKKYWHELPRAEVQQLIGEGKTWGYVESNFLQPSWCGYPRALQHDFWGCMSLTDIHEPMFLREKISVEFCKNCDCYNDKTITVPNG